MTTFIYGPNREQFDDYRSFRSGQARQVTWIADATTLATVTGSGHTIIQLAAYHARGDADVIETQIADLVRQGRATVTQSAVGVESG